MNLKSDETVVFFFLDFSQTFDCPDFSFLNGKLFKYGFRAIPLDEFKSYFSGRKQCISVISVDSTVLSFSQSLPQGSNTGQMLFFTYNNDFPHCIAFFKFCSFADDNKNTCLFLDLYKQIVLYQMKR